LGLKQGSLILPALKMLVISQNSMKTAGLQKLVPIWLLPAVLAVPAPTPNAIVVQRHPEITPPPSLLLRSPDLGDVVGSYVGSVLSDIGSGISSFVASGVPEFYQNFPTGAAVQSSVSASDSDLATRPTQVLNLP
jgi:hypothetical protein